MSLLDKRLIVISGKGGVGRTTVAAALALGCAKAGKRVLLAQMRSKDRLPTLFGVPSVGEEIIQLRPGLWAVNINPHAALIEYGTMVLRSEFIAKQVLENKVARAFLRAVPGFDDWAMLGKTWYHTTQLEGGEPKWDLVILDGPATGHVLTVLSYPQAILEAVPEGPLTRPARENLELLQDPRRCAFVIVTLAEDLPTNESVELAAGVRERLGMHLGPLIVNMLYPPRFAQGSSRRALDAFEGHRDDAALAPMLDAARLSQRRRDLNDVYITRLKERLPLPQVALPYLFVPTLGPEALEALSVPLMGQLQAQ